MTPKEFLTIFKRASWTPEDLATLPHVVQPETMTPRLTMDLVDVLCSSRYASDPKAHEQRCIAFSALVTSHKDPKLFVPCVRALRDGDPQVREIAADLLTKVNNFEEHPKLCGLLKSKERHIREAAAEVLKMIGGKTAVATLSHLVRERDFKGRTEAMDAALPLAGHHAIPILKGVLETGTLEEQVQAIRN